MYAVLFLTINYTNTLCRQLQRDIINVSDQQKTDVILFIKRPTCSLYQCITVKLFASGTATCLFFLTRISRLMSLSYLSSKTQRGENQTSNAKRWHLQLMLWHYRFDRKVWPSLPGKTWFTSSFCCIWTPTKELFVKTKAPTSDNTMCTLWRQEFLCWVLSFDFCS